MNFILFITANLIYPQSPYTNTKFVRYSTRMGLSNNYQHCISQDKEGFIWIGTNDGLNRFDGHTFKVYRKIQDDLSSLRSNEINCLFTDSKGILWIGTYAGGLSRYNKESDNFHNYTTSIDSNALLNNNITTIAEDKYHNLWVGTSNGLHLFNPETNGFIRYTSYAGQELNSGTVAHNHIKKIVVDDDILWIAYTTGMLSALSTSTMTFKHYMLFDVHSWHTADFSVNSLILDNNLIWISTWSKGIWIFNKLTGECYPYEKEKSQYINFIFKDNKDQIWYSPESKGLIILKGENKVNYQFDEYDKYSLSTNSLSDMFQDEQGNLWLASKHGDLNYLIVDNPFYTWYKNPNSLSGLTNNIITAVIEDSKNRIWVGYQDGGIDIIDSQNKYPRIHINGDQSSGLGPRAILYIYESKNGTIWVGKYLDGLKKYNESTKKFYSYKHNETNDESIAGNDIRHIAEDSKGNMWLAIHGGGVDKFNPVSGKFTHYKSDENNPSTTIISDWTYTVVCDKEDNIWIGTLNGVSVLSEKSAIVKHYLASADDNRNISNDVAKVIFFDSKGYVWIGTNDGLNKLDRKTDTIKKYFSSDGLPSSVIMDILEDNHYNLWISTAKGLSKFSPEEESFANYSVQDGLVTDEFNTFASFKIPTGEMYFGGREGLNRFHPDSIKINYYKPPVYITDFKLFNQSAKVKNDSAFKGFSLPQQISYCKEIELHYHKNVITFEFVALNYLNLEKNQYRYKLEGFEEEWTLPGYKREVTYTNLHPGEYTFRVMASNNDGIWNTEGASLKIIINPPFWRTIWAYMFYLLLVIGLLYFFRKQILRNAEIKRTLELEKLEIQKLQEMDALKMQFFSNVSHEFRTPLTLIVGPLEKLIQNARDEFQQMQLTLMYRNANRLLRLINQLMDFRKTEKAKLDLNPTKSDIVHFIKELSDAFDQEAKQRNIDFTFNTSHSSFELWFDSDKLDKIIYNLLSNAFKYTPDKGKISISLTLTCFSDRENTFNISVKDTGIGIPKKSLSKIFDRFYQVKNSIPNQGTGIGLSFAHELVKLHKGSIKVTSELNKGSEFTVILPQWLSKYEIYGLTIPDKRSKTVDNDKLLPDEKEEQSLEQAKAMEKRHRLLIIEDNADMRLFIKNEFIDNYTVFEAYDGISGYEKALEEMPDAIICDVMMAGMDGYEVCKNLKNDERTSHIPIIILTAKRTIQHTIEGLESGADDYIVKPFSSAILKVRVKNLIESRILLRNKFVKEPFVSIKEISQSTTDERLFKKAYAIVEENMNNPDFEAIDFANAIGMSRAQLYRKIHAISGQSVKEFIRIIRLKKAAELLFTTDKNISEVAFTVGFNSVSYFTTSFSEYFGLNPSKYIEKYIKV